MCVVRPPQWPTNQHCSMGTTTGAGGSKCPPRSDRKGGEDAWMAKRGLQPCHVYYYLQDIIHVYIMGKDMMDERGERERRGRRRLRCPALPCLHRPSTVRPGPPAPAVRRRHFHRILPSLLPFGLRNIYICYRHAGACTQAYLLGFSHYSISMVEGSRWG